MGKKRTERVDRISELPESILHHILSFLPFKKVAKTSVLSKRWERVWRTYPVMEFDETIFCRFWGNQNLLEDAQKRSELFNCVTETMCNRHEDMISLTKFTLSLPWLSDDGEFTSFVNQCVCHAIGCNVNQLKLSFTRTWYDEYIYNLPQIVLFAKSLKTLKLEGCKVELPRSDLNLSSLRKLTFSCVHIDDHMIKNLVSGFPLIEHLNFTECKGFKNIELFGLPRLYKFKLLNNDEIEWLDIKSPIVRSLRITWSEKICEINLASCKNLTRLTLIFVPIMDEWLHGLISILPVLEFLSIGSCYKLRTVKISSSCLKELDLYKHGEDNWIALKIDTPNLRSLKYRGTIISLSLNATTLSEINLYCVCKNDKIEKYIEFLANFHHFSEVLSLEINAMYENVIIPIELRRTISSPLSGPELSKLRFRTTQTCVSIAKLVDSLLWIAPHTKTISIRSYKYELSLKFTYKKQQIHEGETTSCCKSHPISCWDCCMEAVDVKFTDYLSNSIMYTLTGAHIWEKIVARWEKIEAPFDVLGLLKSD